ncbi:MAG: hypothetical protein ACYS1C_00175 [Planctomycetota bacterium]|jgi:transposase
MSGYRFRRVRELVRQLAVGPIEVRRRQAERLEELLVEVRADRSYPYEFLYFRITGFRPKDDLREAYEGADVLPDLQRALRELSSGAPRAVEDLDEEVCAPKEVAAAFSVSPRTVRRWQGRGLPRATYLFPDGHKGPGIRQSVLDRFLERHGDSVERSARFSKLSEAEERDIVRIARQETVRLVLLSHDRDNPDRAIFGRPSARLTPADRRRLRKQYLQGVPVEELCEHYGRSRSTIYRLINEERAREMLQEPLSCYREEDFGEEQSDERILAPALRDIAELRDQPPQTGAGAEEPRRSGQLTPEQERALFRAYNYAKFRADEMRKELKVTGYVPSRIIGGIEEMMRRARRVREFLLRVYAPLAEHAALQHSGPGADLQELRVKSRAQLARLIDSFDYRKRARFEAYANLDLLKTFARAPVAEHHAGRERQ